MTKFGYWTIGTASLGVVMCLVPTAQSISDDTLEQRVQGIVQRELAKQAAAPARSPPPPQSDISLQLKELTETINKLGSRLENVETAINTRTSDSANAPASFASAQVQYTDPVADDPDEKSICTKGPSYDIVGQLPVVEGDIVIGPAGRPGAYSYFAPAVGVGSNRLWPKGNVPYVIEDMSPDQRAEIVRAINKWQMATKGLLYFRDRTPQDKNYITFTKMPPGEKACGDSPPGMVGNGKQLVRLQLPATTGCANMEHTIAHEIGHAIGLFHEHTRDNRNQYVKIIWKNIDSSPEQFCRVMYNKYLKWPPGEDLTKEYDFKSIMHYGVFSGAKPCPAQQAPETCRTIVPLHDPGIAPDKIGALTIISDQDVKAVERLYGQEAPPQPPKPQPPKPQPPKPQPKIVWCCCCWRYRPIDCWGPRAWGRGFWRPPPYRVMGYFDDYE